VTMKLLLKHRYRIAREKEGDNITHGNQDPEKGINCYNNVRR
jgi:hypothetical protein